MTSPPRPYDAYRLVSFDCYGTLIDWETGIVQALQAWSAWRGLRSPPAELLEAFGRHEHVVQATQPTLPYPAVLAECLRRVAADLGQTATAQECHEFGDSVGAWPAFPDTAVALRRLRKRYLLAILSNVDRASFARTNRRLGVDFDLVITAEDVGSYKPDLGHFHSLLSRLRALGLQRRDVLHVAQSLFHDHAPARQVGLTSVWIDRRHDRSGPGATPAAEVAVPHRFASLADFADAAVETDS